MSYVCEFDECSSITIPPPPPPRSSFTLSCKTRTIEDLEDRMVIVAESMNCY